MDTVLQYYNTDQYQNGYFLGFDRVSNKLRLFDKSGNFLNFVGSKGEDPGSYFDIGSFFHFSPDSILVADFMKGSLLLYNKEGQFVNKWNINLSDTLNSFPEYYNNGNLYAFYDDSGDFRVEYAGWSIKQNYLTTPEYYEEAKLLISMTLIDTPDIQHYISYPQDSPYRKGQYMFSFFDPFVKRLNNGNYLALYGHDDRLFLYDKEKKLIEVVECNSEIFPEPESVSFNTIDRNFIVDQVKYNYKHNSINYLNIIEGRGVYHGKIFKQYQAPMGDTRNIPNNLNAMYSNYYKRDSYLQIFDSNFDKIYRDILQPEILKNLLFVDENGNLLFSSNGNISEENILYVAKIKPN